jgi:uncharacterized protein (TIRG00374 family)
MKRALKLLLLALGLALFAWFVQRAGPREILNTFEHLGLWLPVVLLPYLCVYLFDTLGWSFAFGAEKRRPSYPALFRFRWAGETVNNVIPTGYVGGEAVKVWLLRKRGYPMLAATTSVVISKTLQIAAQVLFIGLGAWMAFARLPAGSPGRRGMAVVALIAVTAILLLLWIQHHGWSRFVHSLASRWRIRALEKHEVRLRELDERIQGFYRRHPRALLASGAAYFAGWICDALELFVVSHLLGFPMDYPTAIAIESFISVAKALGVFVPAAIGVQESGVWMLFHLFGFTAPQAVAYAILRRGREVVYAAIGAALLYLESGSLRGLGPRVEAGSLP